MTSIIWTHSLGVIFGSGPHWLNVWGWACRGLGIARAKPTRAGWLLNTVSFSPPVDSWLFPECSCAFLIALAGWLAGWGPWPGANKTRVLYSSRVICISNELGAGKRKKLTALMASAKCAEQRKLSDHVFRNAAFYAFGVIRQKTEMLRDFKFLTWCTSLWCKYFFLVGKLLCVNITPAVLTSLLLIKEEITDWRITAQATINTVLKIHFYTVILGLLHLLLVAFFC